MHTDDRWKSVTARPDVRFYNAQPGREFLYRPDHLLVSPKYEDDVHERLQRLGIAVEHRETGPVASRFHLSGVDALELTARVWHDEGHEPGATRAPSVGVNHIFVGEPVYAFGPADAPHPAAPMPAAVQESHRVLPGAGVTVLVLDTGLAHPDTPASDRDPLDDRPTDGLLDAQAGHGTFVADIIRRIAPGAEIDVKRVLDGDGLVDEYTLVAALDGCQADVVNLSLGGFTAGDTPPIALAKAIAGLDRRIAPVLAGGIETCGLRRRGRPPRVTRVVLQPRVVGRRLRARRRRERRVRVRHGDGGRPAHRVRWLGAVERHLVRGAQGGRRHRGVDVAAPWQHGRRVGVRAAAGRVSRPRHPRLRRAGRLI